MYLATKFSGDFLFLGLFLQGFTLVLRISKKIQISSKNDCILGPLTQTPQITPWGGVTWGV